MKHADRIGHLLGGSLAGWVLYVSGASAAPLSISDVPLFLSTGADPNVMIMLDNSGSMTNVVPDVPYDPNVTYPCSGNVLDDDEQIDIRITGAGLPYIRYNGRDYDWGLGSSGDGVTGKSKRCFDPDLDYMARLYGDSGSDTGTKSPGSYLAARYSGNYLNWFFGTDTKSNYGTIASSFGSKARTKPGVKNRMQIAQSAGSTLVDIMSSGMRVGLSTYNGGDGGRLLEPVGSLTLAKRNDLKDAINALSPSGNTPLAETLSDIGWYFSRGASRLTLHPDSAPQQAYRSSIFDHDYSHHSSWNNGDAPIQYSCQKSFAVLLTDGRPQGDRDMSSYLEDYDGDCANGNCYSYDRKPDREYESEGSDYLDDVAMALFDMDLRPDLVDAQGAKNNVISYFISFADDQAIEDPLMPSAAAQGGGEFFIAGNEAELTDAFQKAFSSIVDKTSSASAVATNSTRLDTNTLVFQAKFRSDDWTGNLLAYQLQKDGTLGALAWDAGNESPNGSIPAEASREIFTLDPATGDGILFSWGAGGLTDAQKTLLNQTPDGTTDTFGQQRVLWLRGDRTNEQSNNPPAGSPVFRNRSAVLGDIVNSDPQFAGAQNFGYDALPVGTPGRDEYRDFRNSKVNQVVPTDEDDLPLGAVLKPMIYVGANDGMLHAFDAVTGEERFAYVPSVLIPKLNRLMEPSYSHEYYVDGQSFIGDAYINNDWATVLVGTLGAGGRAVYALDITDPYNFDQDDVLWEFTDPDLGHVIGQASVARMADGSWVAVFGNGYNSDDHKAVLFIVDLATGTLLKKIDTGVGDVDDPNGLGTPSLLADATRTIHTIYAGDLHGNMWKFDVSSETVADWDVDYKSGTTNVPLFEATDGSNPQPITAAPEIGRHPQGGYMVYFGTGKYFETGDNQPPYQTQTFYAIWDKVTANPADNTPIATGRAALQEQTVLFEGTPTGSKFEVRITSDTDVDWDTKRGWYLDLPAPGERVVSLPILRNGRVIFPTLVPSTDPCDAGGTSWLMELEAVSGSRLDQPPIDINEDGSIDVGDLVDTGEFDPDTDPDNNFDAAPSGVRSRQGIIDTPAVILLPDGEELKVASGTEGNLESLRESGAFNRSRGSWRQLR